MLLWLVLCQKAQVAEHYVFGFIVKSYRHGSSGRHRGGCAALGGARRAVREQKRGFGWVIRLQQVMNPHVTRNYVTILKQYPGFCVLVLIRTMRSKPSCASAQLLPAASSGISHSCLSQAYSEAKGAVPQHRFFVAVVQLQSLFFGLPIAPKQNYQKLLTCHGHTPMQAKRAVPQHRFLSGWCGCKDLFFGLSIAPKQNYLFI